MNIFKAYKAKSPDWLLSLSCFCQNVFRILFKPIDDYWFSFQLLVSLTWLPNSTRFICVQIQLINLHWHAANIWPLHPTTCHPQSFQPINWRLTSGLGKKLEEMPAIRANRWQWILQNPKRKSFATLPMHPLWKEAKEKIYFGIHISKAEASDIWPNKANLSNRAKIFSTMKRKEKCARSLFVEALIVHIHLHPFLTKQK